MNSTKTRTAVAIGALIILVAGSIAVVQWKRARSATLEKAQAAKITAAVDQIKQVNTSLPDLQVQAKMLIFTAMMQKRIPAASKWCETLNVDGKLWPVTPTNTAFAVNAQVAGREFSRSKPLRGDIVVFFEASNPGWNLAGGPELLVSRPEGVAVAFADGRAMIVTPTEAAKLRWAP